MELSPHVPHLCSKVTQNARRVRPLVYAAEEAMTAPTPTDLLENALLAKLRDDDLRRITPHIMVMDLQARSVLQQAGETVVDTWFPCGPAMAAFNVWVDDDTPAVEVALVGREGAVGGIVSNGNVPAFATCHVLAAGRFLQIKTSALEQCKLELNHCEALVLALFGLPAGSNVSDGCLQCYAHHCATHGQVAVSLRCADRGPRV